MGKFSTKRLTEYIQALYKGKHSDVIMDKSLNFLKREYPSKSQSIVWEMMQNFNNLNQL